MLTRYAIIAEGSRGLRLVPFQGARWSFRWGSDRTIDDACDEILVVTKIWHLHVIRRYKAPRVLQTLKSVLSYSPNPRSDYVTCIEPGWMCPWCRGPCRGGHAWGREEWERQFERSRAKLGQAG